MSIDYSLFKFAKGRTNHIKRNKNVSMTNRNKIKELCHYQCVLCGRKGTQVHHIVYRNEDSSKIDDLDNLILLCVECHQKVHADKKHWQPKLIELRQNLRV